MIYKQTVQLVFSFHLYLMFCAIKFDVTENLEKFLVFKVN